MPACLFMLQVVFTASLAKYADPLLDMLDKRKVSAALIGNVGVCAFGGGTADELSACTHSSIVNMCFP
jgi:hypothetical protein